MCILLEVVQDRREQAVCWSDRREQAVAMGLPEQSRGGGRQVSAFQLCNRQEQALRLFGRNRQEQALRRA